MDPMGKNVANFLHLLNSFVFLIIDPTKGFITIFYPTILG